MFKIEWILEYNQDEEDLDTAVARVIATVGANSEVTEFFGKIVLKTTDPIADLSALQDLGLI